MKKLSLFFALMMISVCLAGCGGYAIDTSDAYGKYDELIRYIEKGDYNSANKELESLMGVSEGSDTADSIGADTTYTTESTGIVTDVTVTEKPENKGPDYLKYESLVVGEWIPSIEEKQQYSAHPIFSADKSCELFSEKLTWKIVSVSNEGKENQELEIAVYAGGEFKYRVYHRLGEFEKISINNRLDSQMSPNYPFYRASDYTRVEITLDNIREYFEDRDIVEFQANAFGEVNHVDVVKFLVSKEGCVVNPDISNVAVEYSHVTTEQSYTVDLANKTVTFGEPAYRDATPDINDTKLGLVYLRPDVSSYGHLYLCGTTPIQRFPTGTVYRDVFTITRAAGFVYIKK